MKKIILILVTCLISLFSFTACNVVGSEDVTGISFVQEIYYVDLGVETKLNYEVYPKSATGYVVSHDFSGNQYEQEFYTYRNGVIKVTNSSFTSLTAFVQVNSFKDSCEVRLKEYPSSISFENASLSLGGGLATTLELDGVFNGEKRVCGNGEFNYKLVSSDPTIVQVVDSQRLAIKSTGRRGHCNISVSILNSLGQDLGLNASISVDIDQYVGESFVSLSGYRLNDGDTKIINAKVGDTLSIDVKYFDQTGFLMETAGYYVFLSNENVVLANADEDAKTLEILGDGEVYLTIQSKKTDASGNPVKIKVLLDVRISE